MGVWEEQSFFPDTFLPRCLLKSMLLVWVDHLVSIDEIPVCGLELWALLEEMNVNGWASICLQRT